SFVVFEGAYGFAEKGKGLGAKNRPACVHAFMKEHRRWGKPQDIGDLTVFNEEWWAWWGSLQPSGRTEGMFNFARPKKLDWEGLERCNGGTGFILMLGSLLWWGEAAYAVGKGSEPWWNWREALIDFTWAIEHMIRTTELGSGSSAGKAANRKCSEGMEAAEGRKSKVLPQFMNS
ncbi:hypothetical protein EV421DRAFT_1714355, partial [Armillaria borealis]